MKHWRNNKYYLIFCLLIQGILVHAQRQDISLDKDWESFALPAEAGKQWTMLPPLDDYKGWNKVNIPHNWDQVRHCRQDRHRRETAA